MDVSTKLQVLKQAAQAVFQHTPLASVGLDWRIDTSTGVYEHSEYAVVANIMHGEACSHGRFGSDELTAPTPESIAIALKRAIDKLPPTCPTCGDGEIAYTDELHRQVIDVFDELGVDHD